MKQILGSVSYFSETDHEFRFWKKIFKICETEFVIRFKKV